MRCILTPTSNLNVLYLSTLQSQESCHCSWLVLENRYYQQPQLVNVMRFYYTVYSRYNYLQSITYISSASKYNVKHSINWILNVEMLLPNTPWCSWCNANTVVSLTTVICQWSQPEKWEDSESRLSSQSVRWITYINDKYWYPYFLYFLQIDNLISLYNNNWQGRTNQIYFSLCKLKSEFGMTRTRVR